MVISQPPGNNPSYYYYRASPTLPQLLWMFPETPYVLYMQLQHQGNSEMVLLSAIFTRIRSTEGSSADCSLFILSLHALALHLAVKILLQIFYEDLSTFGPYTSVGCISLQNAIAGMHFVTQTILLSKTFLIFDINHQQNTRRSDSDWNDKNDNATMRPRITWKVLPMAQVAIFKEIFDQVWKDLDCELFYSELNVTTFTLYLLSSHR